MIVSMGEQSLSFVIALSLGVSCGFLYDMLRESRIFFIRNDILVQSEDFLFWLFVSVIFFVVFYIRNYADIGFFVFGGFFCGMIIYFLILSQFAKKIWYVFWRVIFVVFKTLNLFFCKANAGFYKLLKKIFKNIKKVLKKA